MDSTAQRDDLLDRLAGIPERVAVVVAGRSERQGRTPASDDGWSVAEIVAHMRAADDIWTPRILMTLTRDHAPLAAYDERRWAEVLGYAQTDVQLSLRSFTLRRAELVTALRRATSEDWKRVGIHEVRGALSLAELVSGLLEHEEEHCEQLEALR